MTNQRFQVGDTIRGPSGTTYTVLSVSGEWVRIQSDYSQRSEDQIPVTSVTSWDNLARFELVENSDVR